MGTKDVINHYHETFSEALQGIELKFSGLEIEFKGILILLVSDKYYKYLCG